MKEEEEPTSFRLIFNHAKAQRCRPAFEEIPTPICKNRGERQEGDAFSNEPAYYTLKFLFLEDCETDKSAAPYCVLVFGYCSGAWSRIVVFN